MENKQPKSSQQSSSVFNKISAWLFSRLKNGVFGHFFTSYDKDNERFKRISKKKNNNGEKRTKRTIARAIEKNPFVNIVPKIQDFLLQVSIRDYGIILFTMAIFTCAMFFVQDYVSIIHSSLTSFIAGAVIGVLSLPMMISKKPIAELVLKSKLSHKVLFSFLGFRDESYSSAADEKSHTSPSIALLSGMILSVISYFLGPLWTLAIIGIIFLAYQVLITPEAGIIIFILTMPFTSDLIMSIISLYVAFCFIIKCVVGRRTFKFEYIDLCMLIMMLVVAYGGFVTFDVASSTKDMAFILCLMTSFFVISNLVRSKEWYKRCIIAICIASTLSSAIAIAQFVLGKLDITWNGFYAFSTIHERVSATFANPDSFALFLVACLPFLLLFIFSGKSAASRVVGLICSAIDITALVLTYSKIGFIGAIAMLILLLIIFHRNIIYAILIFAATAVVLNHALPEQAIEALSSIIALPTNTHAYRIMLFDSAITLIKARPFGIGIGQTAFSLAYSALVGNDAISNVGNTYLQIAVSCGILGLALFVFALIVFFKLCLSYCATTQRKMHRINALAGFCAVFGLLVSGFFGYIWSDKTILTIFCICMALTFAYIKLEREEFCSPKMASIDVLSASIDIEIERSSAKEFIPKRKYVRTPKRKRLKESHDEHLGIKDNELDPVIRND